MTPRGFTAYLGAGSGVAAYRIGASHIDVAFVGGDIYRYTVLSAGQPNLDEMARRARGNRGLATFISRVAHDLYDRKL